MIFGKFLGILFMQIHIKSAYVKNIQRCFLCNLFYMVWMHNVNSLLQFYTDEWINAKDIVESHLFNCKLQIFKKLRNGSFKIKTYKIMKIENFWVSFWWWLDRIRSHFEQNPEDFADCPTQRFCLPASLWQSKQKSFCTFFICAPTIRQRRIIKEKKNFLFWYPADAELRKCSPPKPCFAGWQSGKNSLVGITLSLSFLFARPLETRKRFFRTVTGLQIGWWVGLVIYILPVF